MTRVRETMRSDLRNIVKGGATSRILDLYSIARRYGHLDRHGERPFFLHPRLNRAFIIKHTVRAHERPYVMSSQPVVTKVLVPLADSDLSLGGHAPSSSKKSVSPRRCGPCSNSPTSRT